MISGGSPCSQSAQAAAKAASMQWARRWRSTPRTERRRVAVLLEIGMQADHEFLDVLRRA